MKNKRFLLALFAMIISAAGQAQTTAMADTMRSNGKIYVVVGVIFLICCVLFTYLVFLDRKIGRLEKQNNK